MLITVTCMVSPSFSHTYPFLQCKFATHFRNVGGIKAPLSPPPNFLRGTIPLSPLSLWCRLTLSNSCGTSALAPHRARHGSVSSNTSPSGTPSELRRQDNGTQHKKPPALFRASHVITKKHRGLRTATCCH